jgi:ribonuclease E
VIDFIDMVLESNRELVLRRLLECLARDRTKHQVAEVTSLGLVQMTRKRVGSGLLEAFSVTCECCNGRGVLISMEPVDHTPAHGRDDGNGKENGRSGRDHSSSRNGSGQGSGGKSGAARSGGVKTGSGRGNDTGGRTEDIKLPADAAVAEPEPQPAVAAAGSSSRSRGSRSRATRAAGPAQVIDAAPATAPEGTSAGQLAGEPGPAAEPAVSANGTAPPADAEIRPEGTASAGGSRSSRSRSGRGRQGGQGGSVPEAGSEATPAAAAGVSGQADPVGEEG